MICFCCGKKLINVDLCIYCGLECSHTYCEKSYIAFNEYGCHSHVGDRRTMHFECYCSDAVFAFERLMGTKREFL